MPLALLVVIAVAGACGSDTGGDLGGGTAGGADRLLVAATVAPITSIVSAVVGERARIVGLVPEGRDSHTFEPEPSAAQLLSQADVIFVNGLQLEEPLVALAEQNRREDAEIVSLGRETLSEDQYIFDFSYPAQDGKPNPHLWTSPPLVARYAEVIAERMAALDPDGAAEYQANLAAFSGRIDALDAAMRRAFATIPDGQRKLLTYHDAYAYFAREYGWEVIGAFEVPDFGEPSPKDVAALIEQVRSSGVRAIFGSEVFPSAVMEQIGAETGVVYVDELRDDDLPGEPGDDEHSWLGLMRFDFVTMTRALGGDPAALVNFDITPTVPDRSEYPQ
ncbi:MAG: metal ABC transporter substrate-binding protein [Acidimicrobiales bacterium]